MGFSWTGQLREIVAQGQGRRGAASAATAIDAVIPLWKRNVISHSMGLTGDVPLVGRSNGGALVCVQRLPSNETLDQTRPKKIPEKA